MKRQLRRNAAFGCCVCGLPIYQYHHVVPYSEAAHFRVGDMMLLCPFHHDQATKGALTLAEQRRWQQEPWNVRQRKAGGSIKVNQPFCAVRVGGVLWVGEGPMILVDEQPLLEMRVGPDGDMQVSIALLDETGATLALIKHNEWITGDVLPWDIESDHQKLTIRSASHDIRLAIDARGLPMVLRADLWSSGHRVRLDASGLLYDGATVKGVGIQNLGLVGIALAVGDQKVELRPTMGHGTLVSEPDPHLRLLKALESARTLPRHGPL